MEDVARFFQITTKIKSYKIDDLISDVSHVKRISWEFRHLGIKDEIEKGIEKVSPIPESSQLDFDLLSFHSESYFL
ncbi:hypothetical protein HZS_3396 [Henneguya salminicola]|nr:hypothetical protein HZS_3396 [Henneguya salminicola]